MVNLMKRYLAGEHEAVWQELALGELASALHWEAEAVATETLRRVRRNVDLLVDRLTKKGFRFAGSNPVRVLPTSETPRILDKIERLTGGLPISVAAFFREVGAVDLSGNLGEMLTTADDPLVVDFPEYGYIKTSWDDWRQDTAEGITDEPFAWEFAPDCLHKDDISGGPPFRIQIPAKGADGIVLEDSWGAVPFVSYLRMSIRWAGFPGLRHRESLARQEELVAELTQGFEPF